MSWLDVVIAATVVAGGALGARRGVVRQAGLITAFYVSLVMAARYYGLASGLVVDYLPRADPSVASAYALAGLTAGGTLALTWLSHHVYSATLLSRFHALDHIAGAGLGVAWSWAVVGFGATVLVYGLSFHWGASEALRTQLGMAVDRSQLIGLVRWTVPRLLDLALPWLPGGLPPPLSA